MVYGKNPTYHSYGPHALAAHVADHASPPPVLRLPLPHPLQFLILGHRYEERHVSM